MKVIQTEIRGVLLLEPRVFGDERGYFLETWNREKGYCNSSNRRGSQKIYCVKWMSATIRR